MRSKMRLVLFVCVVVGGSMLFADLAAFAQCPPGTHWSNRYWQCVPNRRMPPPPPPPPGPPPGRSCKKSFNRCLRLCAGVPGCIQNCNMDYNVCRQRRGW